MDKTFAPDRKAGLRMFRLADEHRTPLFSSSALRFSKELAHLQEKRETAVRMGSAFVSGPGRYGNYAVHLFEMLMVIMGPGAVRIKSFEGKGSRLFVVDYGSGRQAHLLQADAVPFQAAYQTEDGSSAFIPECTDYFPRLMQEMLVFFETRRPPVPQHETLEIMGLLDAGRAAIARQDEWIPVEP